MGFDPVKEGVIELERTLGGFVAMVREESFRLRSIGVIKSALKLTIIMSTFKLTFARRAKATGVQRRDWISRFSRLGGRLRREEHRRLGRADNRKREQESYARQWIVGH